MKVKFTIGRKIGLGFGVVIFLTILTFLFTNVILNDSRQKTDQVVQVVTPSVVKLEELNLLMHRSQNLINKWFYVVSSNNDSFKVELRNLIDKDFPKVKRELDSLSVNWRIDESRELDSISNQIQTLFGFYKVEIMEKINSFDSYNDSELMFTVRLPFEEIDKKLENIYNQLKSLIFKQKDNADTVTGQMLNSFRTLQNVIRYLAIVLIIGGILVAFFTVRSIVRPINLLKRMIQAMSKGILPNERISKRSDEIGEMNNALTGLIGALERTTEFARQVGSGNFESKYEPLSEYDTLGLALLKMRKDLQENERVLEKKVIERTEEVVRQKEEISSKNEELEHLYKQVTDSIKYAKRIQDAILPPKHIIKQALPESFVLFKPKDIVSGDFYWVEQKDGKSLVAAVDCTGHGVPGAFMSIVGYNLLKEIVKNTPLTCPASIMDLMSEGVNKTLHNKISNTTETKDGMDMSLLSIDFENYQLEFACAFNPVYLARNGEIVQFKPDKFPVGHRFEDEVSKFTLQKVQLQKGDVIYIFSDGYADQFGGPKGKKFMGGRFRDVLAETSQYPIKEQKQRLSGILEDWRGELEQVDDILIIGIAIN